MSRLEEFCGNTDDHDEQVERQHPSLYRSVCDETGKVQSLQCRKAGGDA